MNKRLHCGAWSEELGAGSGYFGAGSMEGEKYSLKFHSCKSCWLLPFPLNKHNAKV